MNSLSINFSECFPFSYFFAMSIWCKKKVIIEVFLYFWSDIVIFGFLLIEICLFHYVHIRIFSKSYLIHF
jgi:hypothetical protein